MNCLKSQIDHSLFQNHGTAQFFTSGCVKKRSSMHGPAIRPHRDFRAPYCTLRRWKANTPPNLPRPPPPAPAGERASQPGFETAAPHSQTQKTLRQSRKRNRKSIRKERGLTCLTATMSRQPLLQLAVSLQLPLQLLDRGVHPDCTLSWPFYAPTPTVRADVPASPASQGETH